MPIFNGLIAGISLYAALHAAEEGRAWAALAWAFLAALNVAVAVVGWLASRGAA
jgi:hypothetical protein